MKKSGRAANLKRLGALDRLKALEENDPSLAALPNLEKTEGDSPMNNLLGSRGQAANMFLNNYDEGDEMEGLTGMLNVLPGVNINDEEATNDKLNSGLALDDNLSQRLAQLTASF